VCSKIKISDMSKLQDTLGEVASRTCQRNNYDHCNIIRKREKNKKTKNRKTEKKKDVDKSGIRTHAREDCGGCLELPKRSALDHYWELACNAKADDG
jgi:hypothetical protein